MSWPKISSTKKSAGREVSIYERVWHHLKNFKSPVLCVQLIFSNANKVIVDCCQQWGETFLWIAKSTFFFFYNRPFLKISSSFFYLSVATTVHVAGYTLYFSFPIDYISLSEKNYRFLQQLMWNQSNTLIKTNNYQWYLHSILFPNNNYFLQCE